MAGLLGNIDLTDPNVALAAGLLSGRGNLGANLSAGLLGGQQSAVANRTFQLNQQAQERANRQNDLAQVSGLYSILKQQEFARMLQARQAGQLYTPNPMLTQLEQRMGQMSGLPPLSTGQGSPTPPQAPQAPQSTAPQGTPQSAPQTPAPQAAPQNAAPQGSGDLLGAPAFGIPMEAYLAQDPTGKAYLAALQAQGKPISTRYGVYTQDPYHPDQVRLAGGMVPPNAMPIQMGPGGPSIAPLPGQLDTTKAIVNAQEAGKAPYDIKMVTTASGATVPMSVSELAGKTQPPAPSIPPEVSAAAASGKPFVATQAPGQSPQFQPPPPSAAPVNAPADPWATMPKISEPPGLGQSTYQAGVSKARADELSRTVSKMADKVDAAQTRLATNQQAEDLLNRADTGTGAAMLGDVKTLLVSRFGIPESDFKNDPAATTALNKDLMNAAIMKAKSMYQGAGRMTQQEVMNQIKRGAPNGDMLKGAIKFLLDSDNASAKYDIQQANDYGRFIASNGDPLLFNQWYAKTFPLSKAMSAVVLPQAGQQSGWSVKRVQ